MEAGAATAAAMVAEEAPEAAEDKRAQNHCAGNSWITMGNVSATIVALSIQRTFQKSRSAMPRVQKHCRLGMKCNMRHIADEKAHAVASSTAGSSRASADQDSGSDYGSGESDDDDDNDDE